MRRSSTVSAWKKSAARMPRLRGEELLSGRAGAAGCGADPGGMQDLPDRGGSDRVAGSDEFALHAPVPPGRIVRHDADHELADRGLGGRSPGTPPAGAGPICGRPAGGARPAAPPGSPRAPRPAGAGGSAATAPRATAGRRAGSGPGRPGGAAPRSRAGAPGVRCPWTPPAGPAPSGSRAGGARAGRRQGRSPSDDPKPGPCPGQACPDRVIGPYGLCDVLFTSWPTRLTSYGAMPSPARPAVSSPVATTHRANPPLSTRVPCLKLHHGESWPTRRRLPGEPGSALIPVRTADDRG
jgi:hypothetical protein